MKHIIGIKETIFKELPEDIKDRSTIIAKEEDVISIEVKEEEMKNIICYCFEKRIEGATELLESMYI